MAAKKGHDIANVIMSSIVLDCGILFCVLVACLTTAEYGYNWVWTFGFAFIITGLTGIICAFVKTRGGYITHLTFGLMTLFLKGALFIFSISVGSSLTDYNDTREYSMAIGVVSVVVIGWILTLVTTILSGISCKQEVHVPSQMDPQTSYLPQTHDNAKLVSSME